MSVQSERAGASSVLFEKDDSLPLVHVSVSTLSGAREDPPGLEGVARVCSRLMRRTAGGRSLADIDADIDRMGASLGIDCGHGSASLSGSVLSRSLPRYLKLLEETLVEPAFSDEELGRLKRETLAELIEILDSDQHLVQRWFHRALFAGHAYGRTVIGTKKSLERMTASDVEACHRRLFRSGQMLFGFAGDAEPSQCHDAAAAITRRLDPSGEEPAALPDPTGVEGRHLVFVDKPDRTQTQILIGGLGSHPRDDDHFAMLVANTAFGGTFTARLTQEVRSKRGWSYGAYSSLAYEQHRQSFSMWTFPKAEDAGPCIELKLSMLEELVREGLLAEELESAKTYMIQSRAFATDSVAKRIGLLLDERLSDLPPGFHRDYVERIRAVTLEDVNAALRRRISPRDLVIAVVGTQREIGVSVARAVGELRSERIVPFDAD